MALSTLVLLTSSLLAAQPTPTGGFIDFPASWADVVDNSNVSRTRKAIEYSNFWRKQFAYLKLMHLDTVIVQYAVYDADLYFDGKVVLDGAQLSPSRANVEARALNIVMKQAEAAGINVWVGLRQRCDWNNESWSALVAYPEPVINETLAVGRALKASGVLNSHRFAGWYISPEIDNFQPPDSQVIALWGNEMLRRITSGLKKIAPRPVAISGYFRVASDNMTEPEFFNFLGATLAGSGIDVFLFQDSVGVEDSTLHPENGLTPAQMSTLVNRHAGIIKVCAGVNVTPWADVELFVGDSDTQTAGPARVLDQLTAAAGYPKRVVYDVDTDMTPLGTKPGADNLFQKLYEWLAGQP
jgi:Domain of unknown function (DUF4434)